MGLIKPSPYVNDSSLIAYWKMDETSGSIMDYTGKGRLGSPSGSYTSGDGVFGKCGVFNGVSGTVVQYAPFVLSSSANSLTFAFWVKCSRQSYYQTIISDSSQGSDGFIWCYREINSEALRYQYSANAGYSSVGSTNFFTNMDNKFIHATITVDYTSGTVLFYKNGVLFTTQSCTGTPVFPNKNVTKYIGSYNATLHPFKGSIDDFRIYDRVLSASEIYAQYAAGVRRTC